jgi:hypothetical protein
MESLSPQYRAGSFCRQHLISELLGYPGLLQYGIGGVAGLDIPVYGKMVV